MRTQRSRNGRKSDAVRTVKIALANVTGKYRSFSNESDQESSKVKVQRMMRRLENQISQFDQMAMPEKLEKID